MSVTTLQLKYRPQFFSPRSKAPCHLRLSSDSPFLHNQKLPVCFNEAGLLTPTSEDFNQVLLESWKRETGSQDKNLSPVRTTVVAVIGVGYVGYQLVQAFAKKHPVIAYDMNKQRIKAIHGEFEGTSVHLTSSPQDIAQATHILIAVPTRIHEKDKSIDTSHLRSAIQTLAEHARPGAVVVVESSVAVGMTRDLLTSYQQSMGFKVGMSPERVDPGRKDIDFEAIPKVVSGLDSESLQSIQQLYESVFDNVVPVSSCEVAEMTKLYENCQRMIGIAYANEMADACQTLGIDPLEVCSAAATKPFGYQPYLPGPGVGGHCIPVNPYYLLSNMQFPLLQAATEKMWQRPAALARTVMDSVAARRAKQWTDVPGFSFQRNVVSTAPTRILVVGVGFKPGQSVTSHSPGIAMIEHLTSSYSNIQVEFCDPLVGAEAVQCAPKINEASDWNVSTLDHCYDAIIVAVAQLGLDLDVLSRLQTVQVFNFTSSLRGFGSRNDQGVPIKKQGSVASF